MAAVGSINNLPILSPRPVLGEGDAAHASAPGRAAETPSTSHFSPRNPLLVAVAFAPRAAYYVDRLLKGAKVADLPVGQASTFKLTVNLKTAKTLGITIPQSIMLRADGLIR